jgi:hypothetical protein
MPPIVFVFKKPPDGGKGYHRDFRVRWALEEVGQPVEFQQDLIRFSISRCLTRDGAVDYPAIILSGVSGFRQNEKMDQTDAKTKRCALAVSMLRIPIAVHP